MTVPTIWHRLKLHWAKFSILPTSGFPDWNPVSLVWITLGERVTHWAGLLQCGVQIVHHTRTSLEGCGGANCSAVIEGETIWEREEGNNILNNLSTGMRMVVVVNSAQGHFEYQPQWMSRGRWLAPARAGPSKVAVRDSSKAKSLAFLWKEFWQNFKSRSKVLD